jgi:hypothetical protein
MTTKLNLISNVITGVFAHPIPFGDIIYLQAKHFDEQGNLISELHPDLQLTKSVERHLLQADDILFAAKGVRNFATLYKPDWKSCIASTSFFVIRLQDHAQNILLPAYLQWFLNYTPTMRFLKSKAIGTSLPSISKAVLAELDIIIPDIKTQETILKLAALRQEEARLSQQIQMLRQVYWDQQIAKCLT